MNDHPSAPVRLMLVDDNAVILDSTRRALDILRPEWEVYSAGNATDCLASLEHQDVDVALVDVMLPDLSGLELCGRIKARLDIPVLLFSGAVWEAQQKAAGLDYGADDYLNKPLLPLELVARIEAILRRVGRAPRGAAPPVRSQGYRPAAPGSA